jgi:hypothetical protein
MASQLQVETLEEVLCHTSHEARSSAVAILIASPSTARPYTCEALELLERHLPSFHADSDSKFRYDVLGHSRNMIRRIQGALESLRRDYGKAVKKAAKHTDSKAGVDLPEGGKDNVAPLNGGAMETSEVAKLWRSLDRHERFISWYADFLKGELVPTASYQRHITALRAINFVLSSSLPQEIERLRERGICSRLFELTSLRYILDLVMDPFDDVRDAAASLAATLSGSTASLGCDRVVALQVLREFCQRAEELAGRTGRADHSDGLARSYELLWRWTTNSDERMRIAETVVSDLESKVASAEKDLASAVLTAPVHGTFASLRYVFCHCCGGPIADKPDISGQLSQAIN